MFFTNFAHITQKINIKRQMNTFKKCLPDVVAILLFALIGFAYFFVPVTQNKVLFRHDSQASKGLGAEQTRRSADPLQSPRYRALQRFCESAVRAGGEERQGRGCEGFLSERLREADARIQPGLLLPAESELRLNDTLKSGETGTQFPLIVFLRRMENRKMR